MENNIEKLFKSALANNEAPFDPKAWEAMSKRLDQALPVGSVPKSPLKWSWVATAIVLVGISAYLVVVNEDDKQNQGKPATSVATTSANTSTQGDSHETTRTVADKVEESADYEKTTATTKKIADLNQNPLQNSDKSVTESTYSVGYKPSHDAQHSNPIAFIAPKVNESYCQHEQVTIVNENPELVALENENGGTIVILGNSSTQIELSNTGTYAFVYKQNGKTHKEVAFHVKNKPKVDFVFDPDMLYDKGLPVNNVKAAYTAESYSWKNAKGEIISKEKEFDIHLFTKGLHDVTLTIEDQNGCKNSVTKAVRCDFNYNLLAVTGFDPSSPDPRNNTFLPFALLEKQRNIRFEMVIIDPKTGEKVFETKSADQPWDGIDKRTNQLVEPNSTYIWKVTIFNRAVGENSNTYQGSITRI